MGSAMSIAENCEHGVEDVEVGGGRSHRFKTNDSLLCQIVEPLLARRQGIEVDTVAREWSGEAFFPLRRRELAKAPASDSYLLNDSRIQCLKCLHT